MGDVQTKRPIIAEIFSPPRVTNLAREEGVGNGFALDLRTTDDQRRRWDFDKPECRQRAWELVERLQPTLLIGSPECTPFSMLQGLNQGKFLDPAAKEAEK